MMVEAKISEHQRIAKVFKVSCVAIISYDIIKRENKNIFLIVVVFLSLNFLARMFYRRRLNGNQTTSSRTPVSWVDSRRQADYVKCSCSDRTFWKLGLQIQ